MHWIEIENSGSVSPTPTASAQSPLLKLHNSRGFKIGSLNIASLYKHIDELTVFMEKQTFDILALNETRLSDTIPDSLINLPGYDLIRRDRNRSGGGVCAYIRNSINYSRRLDLEIDLLEMLALEIKKPNTKPFLVYCWYPPPHSPAEHFDIFESKLEQAEMFYSDIYITGDINSNLLNLGDSYTMRLINILEAYQLSQVISEPTRVTNSTSTLIDLFITNNEESVVHSGVYPLAISDHNLIFAVRKIGVRRQSPRYVETRNFKKFNANTFLSDLRNSH